GHHYISDFGVAKPDKTDGPVSEGMIGTTGYMSPEQLNEEDFDERTDVYSLGVVICQMLSGKPPRGSEAGSSSSKDKKTEHYIPDILSEVPELPPEMQEFVNIAMAKNKQGRYVTTMHLARALNRMAFGEDLTTPRRDPYGRGAAVRTSLVWILGSVAVLLGLFWMFARGGNIPFLAVAPPTPTVSLSLSETPVSAMETFTPLPPTATATLESTPTPEPAPPGGADQIAFLSGNELYLMNTDGSGLIQVRTENSPKSNLQWIADNRLIYLSRNCANMLDANTKQVQQIFCLTASEQLEGFNISPDEQHVAISVQRTLNIFPFDLELLRTITSRFELVENRDNCFYNQFPFLETFWSDDKTHLVSHVIDTRLANSDQLFLLSIDLENCAFVGLTRVDTIPGGRIDFDTISTKRIGSYDWNGKNLFLLNDAIRNDGFGNLYLYDSNTKEVTEINPIEGQCCYRDARWSPDGTYILFAYQRFDRSMIELYYVPFAELQSGAELTPINLPGGFFATARDKPRPALHPAP
ncbi:MAG TPA: protein kinase, partial [Anaerolineales bacterium]|nr:protein kinase [Anaerolineales bacterium]